MSNSEPKISVRNLEMAYGSFVIQRDLSFDIPEGDVFIIMGGSGCGKSTLLRHLIGLKEPSKGEIFIRGENFWAADAKQKSNMMNSMGVLYQSGALWSSMTLAENVAIPLNRNKKLSKNEVNEIVSLLREQQKNQEKPIFVIVDDAYEPYVYSNEVSNRSIFYNLHQLDENVIPIKLDGITKELLIYGGRIGFVTFRNALMQQFIRLF